MTVTVRSHRLDMFQRRNPDDMDLPAGERRHWSGSSVPKHWPEKSSSEEMSKSMGPRLSARTLSCSRLQGWHQPDPSSHGRRRISDPSAGRAGHRIRSPACLLGRPTKEQRSRFYEVFRKGVTQARQGLSGALPISGENESPRRSSSDDFVTGLSSRRSSPVAWPRRNLDSVARRQGLQWTRLITDPGPDDETDSGSRLTLRITRPSQSVPQPQVPIAFQDARGVGDEGRRRQALARTWGNCLQVAQVMRKSWLPKLPLVRCTLR